MEVVLVVELCKPGTYLPALGSHRCKSSGVQSDWGSQVSGRVSNLDLDLYLYLYPLVNPNNNKVNFNLTNSDNKVNSRGSRDRDKDRDSSKVISRRIRLLCLRGCRGRRGWVGRRRLSLGWGCRIYGTFAVLLFSFIL